MRKYRVKTSGLQVTTRAIRKANLVANREKRRGQNVSIVSIEPVNSFAAKHFFKGVKKR